jgi:hypothetical protein
MRNWRLIWAGAAVAVCTPALAGQAADKDKPKRAEQVAGVAGSVAGSTVAGPVGGLVGGAIGRAVAHEVVKTPDATAALPPEPMATPQSRTAMAMQAPPAWADPGQAQRERHATPPPAAMNAEEPR